MSHSLTNGPASHATKSDTKYASLAPPHSQKEEGMKRPTSSTKDGRSVGVNPRTLRVRSRIVTSLCVDAISILVAISFFVFSLLGYRAGGNTIGDREQRLLDTTRIAATAFPYIFALILGRTLQSTLSWRLEKGVDCLSFAYLSRSCTLGSAYTAPLQIRCPHWLPPFLLVLWAFSPIGSQASLRFITAKRGSESRQLQRPTQYIYPLATWDSACSNCQAAAHNAMNLAPYLSIGTTGRTPRDHWGNLKIPFIDTANTTTDINGWKQIRPEDDIQYVGLAGIPFSVPQTGTLENTTFLMQSWYWQLENATLRDEASPAPLLETKYNDTTLLSNFTGVNKLWQFAIPSTLNASRATSIPLTFEVSSSSSFADLNNNLSQTYTYGKRGTPQGTRYEAVRLEADMVQRPVELNVTCTSSTCNVTALRHVKMNATYPSENDRTYVKGYLLMHLMDAFPDEHLGTATNGVLEAYLSDPTQNPYAILKSGTVESRLVYISAKTLAFRLAQVLNTYWIIDNYFLHIAGAFNVSDPYLVGYGNRGISLWNSTTTAVNHRDLLHCDHTWLGLLCISTLLMLLAAIASIILRILRLGPNVTDFISALSLNDGKTILEHGSSLDADERLRMLRNVKLQIGDISAGGHVGRIVISEDRELGHLQKHRLYQ